MVSQTNEYTRGHITTHIIHTRAYTNTQRGFTVMAITFFYKVKLKVKSILIPIIPIDTNLYSTRIL
jgi:hypothetical protein